MQQELTRNRQYFEQDDLSIKLKIDNYTSFTEDLSLGLFFVHNISAQLNLSSPFQIEVCFSSCVDLILSNTIGSWASVNLDIEGEKRCFTGLISACVADTESDDKSRYIMTINGAELVANRVIRSHAYNNLNIKQWLNHLFEEHAILNKISLVWRPKNQLVEYEYQVQNNETDLQFFLRIMHENNLVYYYEPMANSPTLVITDDIANFNYVNDDVIYATYFKQDIKTPMHKSVVLLREEDAYVKRHEKTSTAYAVGDALNFNLMRQGVTDDIDSYLLKKDKDVKQNTFGFNIQTEQQPLLPGFLYNFNMTYNLDEKSIEDVARIEKSAVLSAKWIMSQDKEDNENINNEIKVVLKIDAYVQPVLASDSEVQNKAQALSKNLRPSYGLAVVASESDEDAVDIAITEQGSYKLHYNKLKQRGWQERQQKTPDIKPLSIVGGNKSGYHFPLMATTPVVALHLEKSFDAPYVLGAYTNEYLNHAMRDNKADGDSILRSPAGHELKMNFGDDSFSIRLATSDAKNQLQIISQQDVSNIEFNTEEGCWNNHWGGNWSLSASGLCKDRHHKNVSIVVDDDVAVVSKKSSLTLKAANHFTIQSHRSVSYHAEQGDYLLKSSCNIDFEITDGDARYHINKDVNWRAPIGKSIMQTGVKYNAYASKEIVFNAPGACMQFSANGHCLVKAGTGLFIEASNFNIKSGLVLVD